MHGASFDRDFSTNEQVLIVQGVEIKQLAETSVAGLIFIGQSLLHRIKTTFN